MGSMAPSFSSPPQRATFKGLLFDMDGTIIDSTDAVVKHWHTIGKEIGIDPNVILETSHGRRSIDTLKALGQDHLANWEYIKHMEELLPQNYGDDAIEIPGARDLLDAIKSANIPWAIVTSGTSPLVGGWLDVLKLPIPENLVVAEDVENGKPDPSCYLMGLGKLGFTVKDAGDVLVLEDSPAGKFCSGKAAGCKVLGLVTSHTVEQVVKAKPDWIVKDLRSIRVTAAHSDGGVELEILDALKVD
ncbi:glycerol-3-phosphate phosphatase-like protein [Mollisia scopiformis]|uniref:Glycerol-3-phosphate phosphatase-like protein n=1 Tax=Mollisia scopiformis TaxID=149040 RepID=A0A132B6D5_MOLSC|nr:glycerol-3-phosphate phosphatase-like protein [Mollisia scopiformis]KUJ07960.1 glycerol-3-phosphate phosphatase-like protein [Mollisia scopiformis]